jgi:heterodisulfide reductase subunit A-like polyferredoxin
MDRKILAVVLGVGVAGLAFATQAGAEDRGGIPLEKRGIIAGTMAHLKSVTLHEAPAFPAYVVNNDSVERADPETAKFIAGLLSNCLLDFWDQ